MESDTLEPVNQIVGDEDAISAIFAPKFLDLEVYAQLSVAILEQTVRAAYCCVYVFTSLSAEPAPAMIVTYPESFIGFPGK